MRYFFKLVIIFFSVTVLAAGASSALIYYYQDEIEQVVIDDLNKILTQPLEIEDVEISAINNFPYTSINLKNIKALDSFGKDTLLKVEKLSLLFNAIDLYNKEYNIQDIVLKNGYTSIYYSNGKPNYEIWKATNDTSAEVNIKLNSILLENFRVKFANESGLEAQLNNKKTQLQLAIEKGITQVSIDADVVNEKLISNDLNLLKDEKINLISKLQINSSGQKISLEFINDKLNFIANIDNLKEQLVVTLKAKEFDIENINPIVPKQFVKYINDYKTNGKVKIDLDYNQKIEQDPIINIEFDANNFSSEIQKFKIENASFSGVFSNKDKKNKIEIKKLNGLLNENPIEAEVDIISFDNPLLKVNLKSELQLSQLYKFGVEVPFDVLEGGLKIDLKYNGKIGLKNKYGYDIAMAQKEANVLVENIILQQEPNSPKLYNGIASLKLVNEQLNIDNISFSMAEKSNMRFKGAIDNIFKYLFLKNAPLQIGGKLDSDWILVDELLNNDSTINDNEQKQKISFPENIIASLKIILTDLSYDKFHMRNFNADLSYNDKLLKLKKINLQTMSGDISGDLSIQQLDNENLRLISSSKMNQINVRQLFYEFHNFGQNTMRHKHLRGIINSDIYFRNEWDPYFNALEDRLYSFIDLKIEDGQLLDFEPLTLMSDYIALSELKRIKFSTLENQIEIKENVIEIPFMEIYSSAAVIAISGTHSFENEMDYDLKVLLNEILSNKFRRANKKKKTSEFGVIEDDGVKGIMLPIKMEGTVEDPKITPGIIKLGESLKEGFKKEKREFKNILKDEFNKNKANKQEIENTDYNNLIEWED